MMWVPVRIVLDCCPKSQGMMMLVRSMSPDLIAVDEIGGEEDARAVEYAGSCGCALAASLTAEAWKRSGKNRDLNAWRKKDFLRGLSFWTKKDL